MNLVFIGKQGVGKGTYAQKLAMEFEVPQVSTGDLLRTEIKSGSELGKKLEKIINRGELVGDIIVAQMLERKLADSDTEAGFILDGFPRTIKQAQVLDGLMEKIEKKIELAVNFTAPNSILLERLTGRRQCKNCSAIFHVKNMPPKVEGVCDRCGGTLYQREDDTEEAIKKRWQQYEEETAPVLGYYKNQGKLAEIDASKEVKEIYPNIIHVLKEKEII